MSELHSELLRAAQERMKQKKRPNKRSRLSNFARQPKPVDPRPNFRKQQSY